MLHNGNKIHGDPESERSIKEISEFLVKFHDDGDENSIWCKFNRLIGRVHDQELSHIATWNAYLSKEFSCYLKELQFTFENSSSEEITQYNAISPFGVYYIDIENDEEGKKIYNCGLGIDDVEITIASVGDIQEAISACRYHYINRMSQFIEIENEK